MVAHVEQRVHDFVIATLAADGPAGPFVPIAGERVTRVRW